MSVRGTVGLCARPADLAFRKLRMSDAAFTLLDLPAPATFGAGSPVVGPIPDAARPMLVYAIVLGYENVQGNNRFTLFAIEAGTDTGDT